MWPCKGTLAGSTASRLGQGHKQMADRYTKLARLGSIGFTMFTAGLATLSCARKPPAVSERPDSATSDTLRESIARQVGTATCSSPAVCRALPLGSKPCGGPRRYLVYSLEVTDSARLAADAARYSQTEAQRNREKGLVSDCSMLMEPQVSCVSRRCVAIQTERSRQPQ
jgi:hypothetical protein